VVHPIDLGPQAPDHPERIEDAEQQDSDDEPVEPYIRPEGALNPRIEDGGDDGHDQREHHHAHEIDLGKVEDCLVARVRHVLFAVCGWPCREI
jgi:hypothetical protein